MHQRVKISTKKKLNSRIEIYIYTRKPIAIAFHVTKQKQTI